MIDKTNKQKLSDYISESYCNKKLLEVNLYVVNYKYPFENKGGWQLTDAGIELKFENERTFTLCFDREWELVDFFDKPLNEISAFEDVNVFVQTKNIHWKPLLNNYVDRINIHWNWYTDFDENTFYIPQVVEFVFVDSKKLLLAAVSISVKKDTIQIHLDSEGEILIGFTEEIQEIIRQEIQSS
jgi:hypothetical protein